MTKYHLPALLDELEGMVASRLEFKRMMAIPPETLTDIQRAGRFVYLQKLRFGGQPVSSTFRVDVKQNLWNPEQVTRRLKELKKRLFKVTVECLNYDDCIRRYNNPKTFIYLDPPYWDHGDSYGKGIVLQR